MSHRVTTETEMTDENLVATALRAAGIEFTMQKRSVVISEGDATAILNLKTGRLTYGTGPLPEKLGLLKQLYGEAKYQAACEREGITIESRTVAANGDIVLICSMGDRPTSPLPSREPASPPAKRPSKRPR
jgi:hypothetical protein